MKPQIKKRLRKIICVVIPRRRKYHTCKRGLREEFILLNQKINKLRKFKKALNLFVALVKKGNQRVALISDHRAISKSLGFDRNLKEGLSSY